MDLLKVLIVFAFALVILNMLTNGYVWQKLTSYNSEALSKGVACAIGLYSNILVDFGSQYLTPAI